MDVIARHREIVSGEEWERRGRDFRIFRDVDQVEMSAFQLGVSSLNAGILDEITAGVLDDETAGGTDRLQNRDLVDERAIGGIRSEIERRISRLGDAYPFRLSKTTDRLEYVPSETLAYELCTAICLAPSLTSGSHATLPRQFEILACSAAVTYFGFGATAVRTGWPRGIDSPHEQRRFKNLVSALRQLTKNVLCEWIWQPIEGRPEDPNPQDVKDCGVDLVAWKDWLDQRTGRLFLLGQCACGNDWTQKYRDLSLKRLYEWVRELPVHPVRALFTPHHVPDGELPGASREAGLIFDRARFTLLSAHGPLHEQLVGAPEQWKALIDIALSPLESRYKQRVATRHSEGRARRPRKGAAARHSQ